MTNLHRARRRLLATIVVLLVLDLVAVVLLVSPLILPPETRQERVQALQSEVQKKLHVAIPPDRLQSRIAEARQQIDTFYKDRLPDEYSAIPAELGRLAAQHQVSYQAKYDVKDAEVPGLRLVTIDASMLGNYLEEVRFINALERSPLLFLVDSVTLGEQTGGKVRLDLKLETYLKAKSS